VSRSWWLIWSHEQYSGLTSSPLSSSSKQHTLTRRLKAVPQKRHKNLTTGHSLPSDSSLTPGLIDLIYGPDDVTILREWAMQNLPHHSVLQMGEGRLMVGIFINAIACLKNDKRTEETWSWILDKEAEGLHSFNTICYYLQWDPEYLRRLTIESFSTEKPSTVHTNQMYTQSCRNHRAKEAKELRQTAASKPAG